jgi:Siphovirus Gp157
MGKRAGADIPSPRLSKYAMEQMAAVVGAVRARLLEADPDIEEDERLYLDSLDSESEAIDFMRDLGRQYLDCLAFADAIKARIENLELRKARWERRAEARRAALFTLMQIAQLPKLPDTDFDAGFNEGRQKVNEDIEDHVDSLPTRYVKVSVTKKVDKKLLHNDLAAGIKVEHAYLTNAEPVFQIRKK